MLIEFVELGYVQKYEAGDFFDDTNLSHRDYQADQGGQGQSGQEPAAPESPKPQPSSLFFSKRSHEMLFP